MNDEEVAFRIVRLYFEEVARMGFKRQLDLDQMINSYFYTLKKLKSKDAALRKIFGEMSRTAEVSSSAQSTEKQEVVTTIEETGK